MFAFVFNRSFFKDRTMLVFFAIVMLFLIANLVLVFITLEPRNDQVPTRYSDFSTSLLERDSWRSLYALPLFSVVATVFNVILAVKVHVTRRDVSLAILSGALFILFVNLFVSQSLLSLI